MCFFKKIFILFILGFSFCYSNEINWTKVFHDQSLQFIAIDNCDSLNAMAVTYILGNWNAWGAVLKTTDAGETWNYALYDTNRYSLHFYKYPKDISYPSRDYCIISLDSNSFLKTTDGGLTWNDYKIDVPYRVFGFDDVDMYDENNGVMKNQHYLAISHDGFQTWDTMSAPQDFTVFNVEMAAPNSICVLSRDIDGSTDFNERFYRSDDGGKTWDEYPHPDYRIPQELQFVDSLIGFDVGGKETGIGNRKYMLIFKTSDGGHSWESVLDTEIQVSFGLQKLDFYDKDNGIVVGQFGAIFWTHDGGKSWVFDSCAEIYDKIPATMNVCYIRKDRAIITDFWGRIFISEDTTTDVIDEFPSDDDFVLYPNPAADKIKIRFKNEFRNSTQIQIFNSYGQEIKQQHSTSNFQLYELDVSTLSSGVYFAHIISNGNIRKKSFVVMR